MKVFLWTILIVFVIPFYWYLLSRLQMIGWVHGLENHVAYLEKEEETEYGKEEKTYQ